LSSWLVCFDAFVIVASFAIDLLENGNVAEEIASLIVVLRLWRLVKLANEFTVEASEQMEETRKRLEELEQENADLKEELQRYKQQDEEAAVS
jgi:voltage-gated hydrogen channel 1